jgi:hypothetical protein
VAGSSGTGSSGSAGSAGAAPIPGGTGCAEPTFDTGAVESERATVGDGTKASCTEAALREALNRGGLIEFDCGSEPHTIPIAAELTFSESVVLDGGGRITLDGQGQTRLFNLSESTARLFMVRGLTFRNARTDDNGAAIYGSYRGVILIVDSVFEDNVSGVHGEEGGGAVYLKSGSRGVVFRSSFRRNKGGTGGAIHNLLSSLTIVDSVFEENDATVVNDAGPDDAPPAGGYGAAVYIDGASEMDKSGRIEFCGCQFLNNRGAGQGGAVFSFVYGEEVVIDRSLFKGNSVVKNQAGDAMGGGLRHGNGPLQLRRSTFWNNTAETQGGGLWWGEEGDVLIENATFFGNEAGDMGGAILPVGSDQARIFSSTFVSNHAGGEGGAIEGDKKVAIASSIIANNTAGNQWGIKQNCGNPAFLGYEPPPVLAGSGNLEFPELTDLTNNPHCAEGAIVQDPVLDSEPRDNGGPVPTLAILSGSAARDAGDESTCTATDARGEARVGRCDLGAFELQE